MGTWNTLGTADSGVFALNENHYLDSTRAQRKAVQNEKEKSVTVSSDILGVLIQYS